MALMVATLGTLIAFLFYGIRLFNPAEVGQQLPGLYKFLVNKWMFDELYDVMFTRPAHIVAQWCTAVDRVVFDGFLHRCARSTVDVAQWDKKFDETVVDGFVNLVAEVTFGTGRSLRNVQTGQLRQYVMFLAVGVVGIWVLVQLFTA